MIKVGMIGTGVSANYYHLPIIEKNVNYNVTNILNSSGDEKKFYHSEFDLAVITTPNFLHFEQAKKCLLAGKHVLLEKPFTLTLKDANELYNLAVKKKLTINPYFNRRYDQDFLFLKEKIKSKKKLKPLIIESFFDKFIPERKHVKWKFLNLPGSGQFFDISPHLIDQTIQLMGIPLAINAETHSLKKTSKACDFFSITLIYPQTRVVLGSSSHGLIPRQRFKVCYSDYSLDTFGIDTYDQKAKGQPCSDYYAVENFLDGRKSNINLTSANYGIYYEELYKKISKNKFFIEPEDCLNNIKLMEFALKSAKINKFLKYNKL